MGTYKFSCNGAEYYLPVVNEYRGTLVQNPSNLLYSGNKFLKYPPLSQFDISGITEGYPSSGEQYGALPGDENGWNTSWACPPIVIYDIGSNIKTAPAVIFEHTSSGWYTIVTSYIYNPSVSRTYWKTGGFLYSTIGAQPTPELAFEALSSFDYPTGFSFAINVSSTIKNVSDVTKSTPKELRNIYLVDSNNIIWKENNVISIFSALTFTDDTPAPDTDPFGDGGNSGIGGGGGSFDNTSVPIDIPSLPSISASSTGFISLFNPSLKQLNDLASYMWSDLFDVNGWKKIFADPMDAILGLSIVPVAVPSDGMKEVKVGNIATGISLTVAASQFVEVDCGSIDVNEYWGAYLDYEPFTKAEIYLPYIGTHQISVDDIMGKSVHVVYHVDILSGACCAFVKCGDSVLYSFVGQCACSIPVTGNDWTNVLNGTLTIAASIGTMVATGGASAPMSAGMIASTAVNSMKPSVEKSGSMSGTGGILAVQTPYLILTRPNQALPEKQNTFTGYPSFVTSKLGSLSGYTEIEEIHLENIPGTEQEISEIESLLKGGVII